MKSRPILFKGEMVRAILEGRKTQTRRIVKPQPSESFMPTIGSYYRSMIDLKTGECFPSKNQFYGASDENEDYPCPFGKVGDQLWVKETHARVPMTKFDCIAYRATAGEILTQGVKKWTPSIFMPRALSRITLEITGIRVERLQDISEKDALAEGIETDGDGYKAYVKGNLPRLAFPENSYRTLWQSINGAGSWAANPWVWVIEFKKIS